MFSINSNKNSQYNNSLKDKIDLFALLSVMSKKGMSVGVSGQYLRIRSEDRVVKIRKFINNTEDLLVFAKDTDENYKLKIGKKEMLEFFVSGITLSNDQWRSWKKFMAERRKPEIDAHISNIQFLENKNNDNMKFGPMAVARMLKSYTDLHWRDAQGSVDILVSENESKRIFFVFNNGFTETTFYKFQQLGTLLKNLIYRCKQAGIEELVFWDGITTKSKRIRVEELSYMAAN